MKDKIIEFIRQLLIKTVLPIRRKKEEFISKLHFSIAFRISFNYFKLIILFGLIYFNLFILLFLGVETNNFTKLSDSIISKYESGELLLSSKPFYEDYSQNNPDVNSFPFDGLTMRITKKGTNELYYNDISFDISDSSAIFNHIYYNRKDESNRIIYKEKQRVKLNGEIYNFYFQYNLTQNSMDAKSLLPGMIILYLILMAIVLVKGRKGNLKVFSSLTAMSATANRLTVNNLNSERLNVAGAKSELKDLATTINNMLDRIETSYESQKQFVSDASHELRTPIAVIQGYANMLSRWGAKDESVLMESIEAIHSEAKEMQDLVEKLLFLSRHDKKTLKLNKSKFNMNEVVADMIKETKMVVHNRIIRHEFLEDVIVYGDKQALKQAIRVFIDNAVKYSNDNDSIFISCQNKDGDCVITVKDTGIGMTQNDINNIFERFYRSHHVRSEKIGGHGLGLSIAKLIILKHTGHLKVVSQYTKGSTFIITIPNIESFY